VSGPGKEDKPGKDYWRTGDPNLRAKVISSVGVAIIVLTFAVGTASFQYYNIPEQDFGTDDRSLQSRSPEPTPEPDFGTDGRSEPPPSGSEPMAPDNAPPISDNIIISELALLAIPILFIVGIILVIIGIVLYLRKRKRAIP